MSGEEIEERMRRCERRMRDAEIAAGRWERMGGARGRWTPEGIIYGPKLRAAEQDWTLAERELLRLRAMKDRTP